MNRREVVAPQIDDQPIKWICVEFDPVIITPTVRAALKYSATHPGSILSDDGMRLFLQRDSNGTLTGKWQFFANTADEGLMKILGHSGAG